MHPRHATDIGTMVAAATIWLAAVSCRSPTASTSTTIDQVTQLYGTVLVTLVSGNNNDLSLPYPQGVVDLTPDPSGSTVTGIDSSSMSDGTGYWLCNSSTTTAVTLASGSPASSSANRLLLTRDTALLPRRCLQLVWDVAGAYTGWVGLPEVGGVDATSLSTPSRTLGSPFQPSTSRPTLVSYVGSCTAGLTLTTGSAGRVELLVDPSAPPTTVRAQVRCANTGTLTVGLGTTVSVESPMTTIVPAGWHVLIQAVTEVGSPTLALGAQHESQL